MDPMFRSCFLLMLAVYNKSLQPAYDLKFDIQTFDSQLNMIVNIFSSQDSGLLAGLQERLQKRMIDVSVSIWAKLNWKVSDFYFLQHIGFSWCFCVMANVDCDKYLEFCFRLLKLVKKHLNLLKKALTWYGTWVGLWPENCYALFNTLECVLFLADFW